MRKTLKNKSGYSLIELSIALVIIGVLVAGAISAYDLYLQHKKVTVTRDNQVTIKDAIDEFLAANGRYPCPAPIDAAPNDANMGTEICTAPDITVVAGMRDVDGLPGNDPVLIGAIPTRTLNLSNQVMRDGYSRRMTYAVSASLTNDATFNNDNGVIAIQDHDGNTAITPANSGHYIVTSHGPDGLGAYSIEGALYEACTGTTKDTENCDYSDAVFISTLQRSTANNATHYDDFTLHAVKLTPLNPLAGLSCPAGQVISGFDDLGQPVCTNPLAVTCPSGLVLEGFDATGTPQCVLPLFGPLTCPPGEAIRVVSETSEVTCMAVVEPPPPPPPPPSPPSGGGDDDGCSWVASDCVTDGDESWEDIKWLYETKSISDRIIYNKNRGVLR